MLSWNVCQMSSKHVFCMRRLFGHRYLAVERTPLQLQRSSPSEGSFPLRLWSTASRRESPRYQRSQTRRKRSWAPEKPECTLWGKWQQKTHPSIITGLPYTSHNGFHKLWNTSSVVLKAHHPFWTKDRQMEVMETINLTTSCWNAMNLWRRIWILIIHLRVYWGCSSGLLLSLFYCDRPFKQDPIKIKMTKQFVDAEADAEIGFFLKVNCSEVKFLPTFFSFFLSQRVGSEKLFMVNKAASRRIPHISSSANSQTSLGVDHIPFSASREGKSRQLWTPVESVAQDIHRFS